MLVGGRVEITPGCDLDKIGPCVIAGRSGDSTLAQAVQGDLCVELAVAVWAESSQTDPARRAVAKVALLASTSWQGAIGLGANLDITIDESEEFLGELWKARRPWRSCVRTSSSPRAGASNFGQQVAGHLFR